MATYPPPPFPGGYYYPSPFPYTISSYPAPASGFFPAPAYGFPTPVPFPSAFHHAATFPYPTPASAYTPMSGFSPNWPSWPPPAPDPAPSTAPSTFPSTTTSSTPRSDSLLPSASTETSTKPPAPEQTHIAPPAPTQVRPKPQSCDTPDLRPRPPPPPESTAPPTLEPPSPPPPAGTPATPQANAARTTPNQELRPTQSRHSSKTSTRRPPVSSPPSPRRNASTLLELPDTHFSIPTRACGSTTAENRRATPPYDCTHQIEQSGSHASPSSTVVLASPDDAVTASAHSTVNQVAAPAAADGPILTEMKFMLPEPRGASALSPRSFPGTSAATTLITPLPVHAPRMRSSSLGITGTTYVAPHVFGEMPIPNSGHGMHVIAPAYENCCYGYHNQIQSSCVQEGGTNPSEKNLHGMPQSYGFSNLTRQSIILADGTKRSYYTLPADYPSKQASDVIHADRSIKLKEMHVSEEEKQDNDQLLKCFSKAAETGQTSACLSYNSDIFDYTLEQRQQDKEKASLNVQHLRAPPLNVLVLHERRKEWDPGVPVLPH